MVGDRADLDAAIDHAQKAARLDPHGIKPALQLAQLLDYTGRSNEARTAYQKVLENDANMRLDPLKQLSETQRQTVSARIAELEQ
jgi:Flp pilus assembly protein TadD